jgi:hypothetical protein
LRWAVLAAALAILNLTLTFTNVWPTLFVRFTGDLSLEAAILVLALAAARWRWRAPGRGVLRALGIFWVALVAGRYVNVTARSLYGRDINLYWDVRYMPDVGAMMAVVAESWVVVLVAASAALIPLILYGLVRWSLGCLSDATSDLTARRVLVALGASVLVYGAAQRLDSRVPQPLKIAEPVTTVYLQQARQFAYELSGAGLRALPPAVPIDSDLAHVRGADVFLIFLESYGSVSWDRPAFLTALAASRERFAADIRAAGLEVVSTRVTSTTFGGESWLAHISLLTGTEVRDQNTNVRLMAQRRDTLVTGFAREGYRTVALMPGLQRAWPEGRFYGFSEILGAGELAYSGPPFGWWDVTDQYALARLDVLTSSNGARQPLFVFFPTISTHTPFTPTPPYQPQWKRILTATPYDTEELDAAWAETPDWLNLDPGYVKALDYTHKTLGGYLRLHAGRDLVVILIGDHQPPAAVTGEGASWDVPVHVMTSRPIVLDRLRQHGFRDGLTPPTAATMGINDLLPVLLQGFGERFSSSTAARR